MLRRSTPRPTTRSTRPSCPTTVSPRPATRSPDPSNLPTISSRIGCSYSAGELLGAERPFTGDPSNLIGLAPAKGGAPVMATTLEPAGIQPVPREQRLLSG